MKKTICSCLLILGILMIPMSTFALDSGIYTVQQKSSDRYMDAYQSSGYDYDVVMRDTFQNNDTQKWLFIKIPGTSNRFTIQQLSNLRYLDAHEYYSNNRRYRAVTREEQNHNSQKWILTKINNNEPIYRIQQVVNRRFLDAYQFSYDFTVFTNDYQSNTTQQWIIK